MKQHISLRLLEAKNILVNRVQNYQSYTDNTAPIPAGYIRNIPLVTIIYRAIQVQVAEERYLVIIRLSHRSLIRVVK
jgi:hypothetical protein